MTLQYSIKIQYENSLQGNPERVFEAMALFIKGFDGLQSSFLKGFDDNIEFASSLDRTREGSCIADICHNIAEKTRNANLVNLWNSIFQGLERAISTQSIVNSEEDIKAFTKNVYSKNAANDAYLCDAIANDYEIAKNLKLVADGMKKLSQFDTVQIGVNENFKSVSKNLSFPRTPDELFNKATTAFCSRDLLTIKSADYSGEGKWGFYSTKLKGKYISASILHKSWLESWGQHEFQFWPGDALLVDVTSERVESKKKNNKISYNHTITNVLKIIPQEQVSQMSLDYE